jgi:hypothetical protein
MKLRRFLPFFIILLIAGCVGFILIQSDSEPLELEEGGIEVSGCSACTAFMRDMNALQQEDGYSQQQWKSLLSRIQGAGLEPADEAPLIVSWAQLAYDDWKGAFSGWAIQGQSRPGNHQAKIKELKSMLARVNQLTADRLKTLTQHSQAFKNFNWLTQTDFASNFESKRTALLHEKFSESQYTALEDKVNRISQDFPNRPEVSEAKTTLDNQRACHRPIHNYYNKLVAGRQVRTDLGHSNYTPSPSTYPKPIFRHGQDAYKASEFTHYYNQGKSPEWETPVWD